MANRSQHHVFFVKQSGDARLHCIVGRDKAARVFWPCFCELDHRFWIARELFDTFGERGERPCDAPEHKEENHDEQCKGDQSGQEKQAKPAYRPRRHKKPGAFPWATCFALDACDKDFSLSPIATSSETRAALGKALKHGIIASPKRHKGECVGRYPLAFQNLTKALGQIIARRILPNRQGTLSCLNIADARGQSVARDVLCEGAAGFEQGAALFAKALAVGKAAVGRTIVALGAGSTIDQAKRKRRDRSGLAPLVTGTDEQHHRDRLRDQQCQRNAQHDLAQKA